MKTIITLFAVLLVMQSQWLFGQSQTITTLKPTAGLNDGTDDGGPTSGKDAWVYEGATGTNYGGHGQILALPVSNCNSTHCVSFIQFNLSTLPLNVDSVLFGVRHIAHTSHCYSNCDADFYFARVTQAWDEMTINYNNKPSTDTAFYGPINIAFPNDFGDRTYDITNAYRQWKSGAVPNYGFAIYSTTVGCNNAAVYFNAFSSDDTVIAEQPYLKIYTSSTGAYVSGAEKINFSIYPNPAGNVVTVKFTSTKNEQAVFTLTDISGKQVMDEIILTGKGSLSLPVDVSVLKPGLYFYTLKTTEGRVSGKLLH